MQLRKVLAHTHGLLASREITQELFCHARANNSHVLSRPSSVPRERLSVQIDLPVDGPAVMARSHSALTISEPPVSLVTLSL